MLTRPDFDTACKAFISKNSCSSAVDELKGWIWNEHASFPGFGYMSRTAVYRRKFGALDSIQVWTEDPAQEDPDDAVIDYEEASYGVGELYHARQYVVYSPTFRVPAFYFTMHDSQGRPLPLQDLVNTSLFRVSSLAGTELTPFGLGPPDSAFPLLTQGDHPTLGTPCWHLHPCETEAAVCEVMREVLHEQWTDSERLVRWLEAWFMVLSTVVFVGPHV